jgi:hypothetical protein
MNEETPAASDERESPIRGPTRRPRWRGVVLGIVILLCGIVIGAGAAAIIVPRQLSRDFALSHQRAQTMMVRTTEDLGLSPEQRRQVESIIAKHLRAVDDIRADNRARVQEQIDLMKREVTAVLDERQAQLWASRLAELQRHRPSQRARGTKRAGPPHPEAPSLEPSRSPQGEGERSRAPLGVPKTAPVHPPTDNSL